MKEQLVIQKLLRRKLAEMRTRNPAFSVRAFAKRLGLQPAATNEILKGERRISRKMAGRLANQLHLDPSERAEIMGYFPARVRRAKSAPGGALAGAARLGDPGEVLRLSSDQFAVISEWTHFAILNLVKTQGARADNGWMAERLGLTESRVAASMERLIRLGLVKRDARGKWARTYAKINTSDDVRSVSVQKSHLADMDLARESLLRDPVESRDFSSMMIAVSPGLLPQIKEILRRAQDEVAALADESPATEVYRLTSYFFPLTRIRSVSPPDRSPA